MWLEICCIKAHTSTVKEGFHSGKLLQMGNLGVLLTAAVKFASIRAKQTGARWRTCGDAPQFATLVCGSRGRESGGFARLFGRRIGAGGTVWRPRCVRFSLRAPCADGAWDLARTRSGFGG